MWEVRGTKCDLGLNLDKGCMVFCYVLGFVICIISDWRRRWDLRTWTSGRRVVTGCIKGTRTKEQESVGEEEEMYKGMNECESCIGKD